MGIENIKKVKNIAVISDPQIDLTNDTGKIKILKRCLDNINTDALAICGDITENGLPDEWAEFFSLMKDRDIINKFMMVTGNMDRTFQPAGKKMFFEAYEKHTSKTIDKLYFADEMEDCIVIGISPEHDREDTMTVEQLIFLDNNIEKAAKSGRPAIVLSHYLLADTIDIDWEYATLGAESKKIRDILEKYDGKVLFFSGHIHRGLIREEGGSVRTIKNVTYASTPSICKPDTEHYDAENNEAGTGFIVEIGNKHVLIKGYDFINDEYLTDFKWSV